MIVKTRGIVFHFVLYSETSIIVKIFTKDFGLQSYMINGVRSASPKNKIALYQPLMLLDIVSYYKEHTQVICRIKEALPTHIYRHLFKDSKKSSIALFLHEILNKVIKQQTHTSELYTFIYNSLITLDRSTEGPENFHLIFLIKLAQVLGFELGDVQEIEKITRLSYEESQKMETLLKANYSDPIYLTYTQRKNLLISLLDYYSYHIERVNPIRSVEILHEVLV